MSIKCDRYVLITRLENANIDGNQRLHAIGTLEMDCYLNITSAYPSFYYRFIFISLSFTLSGIDGFLLLRCIFIGN